MKILLFLVGALACALGIIGKFQAQAYFSDHPLNRVGAEVLANFDSANRLSREVRYYVFFDEWGLWICASGIAVIALGYFMRFGKKA